MAVCRSSPVAEAGPPLDWGVEVPFITHLGFVLRKYDSGLSEISFEARPEHLNSLGVTHGGACMTLLDVAMARAARSNDHGTSVVTVEMKTTFMRPAKGPLTARGRLLHHTQAMAFTEASVFDDNQRLCAQATGTFRYVWRTGAAAVPQAPMGPASPD